ncbi:MAG: PIN domain-containing protein [Alphaproteobacteria bacterium]|nr:PIN domain-containing protein [Alphaproteobacteria bacterium]
MRSLYLDTSALAKWYLPEPMADEFGAFMSEQDGAVIGRLGEVELRSLLARRRRAGELDGRSVSLVWRTFQGDIGRGYLEVIPLADNQASAAIELFARRPTLALRSLDAVHLAAAIAAEATQVATADRAMATAAVSLGLDVKTFY